MNHNIVPLSSTPVAFCEIRLIAASFFLIFRQGLFEEDFPLGSLAASVCPMLHVNGTRERGAETALKDSCLAVLAVLILEIVSVHVCVALFSTRRADAAIARDVRGPLFLSA